MRDEFPEKLIADSDSAWSITSVAVEISSGSSKDKQKKFSKKQRISSRQNEKKILRAGFEPVSRAPMLYISHSATCESFLSSLSYAVHLFYFFCTNNAIHVLCSNEEKNGDFDSFDKKRNLIIN